MSEATSRPKGRGPWRGGPKRGENPSYHAVHGRIRRDRGRASGHACARCGGQAGQWSYMGDCPDERTELRVDTRHGGARQMPYSLDQSRYEPLCVSCHNSVDNHNTRKTNCQRGHALSGANLKLSDLRRGRRSCLACSRASNTADNRRWRRPDLPPYTEGDVVALAHINYSELMAGGITGGQQ